MFLYIDTDFLICVLLSIHLITKIPSEIPVEKYITEPLKICNGNE